MAPKAKRNAIQRYRSYHGDVHAPPVTPAHIQADGFTAVGEVPWKIWRGPLRTQQGFLHTFSRTEDPRCEGGIKQRKIINYDFARLCHWGAFLGMFIEGGVFRGAWSLVATVATICLIATITVTLLLRSDHKQNAEGAEAVDSLQQKVVTIVTFVLGFFVSANLSRWWSQREHLSQLHTAVLDVLLLLQSSGTEIAHLHEVARWGLLAQALLFEEARGELDSDDAVTRAQWPNDAEVPSVDIPDDSPTAHLEIPQAAFDPTSPPGRQEWRGGPFAGLIRLGLLAPAEVKFLDGRRGKAQLVWVWIARYITVARERGELGEIDQLIFAKTQERLCDGRAAASAVRVFLQTQLPFTYVQLVAMMVQCSHLIIGLGSGYTAAGALTSDTPQYPLIVTQALQALLVPVAFQALLDVCVTISDPFGGDMLDFSYLHFHIALSGQIDSFLSELPPNVEHATALVVNTPLSA